jgi:hypothetical protein
LKEYIYDVVAREKSIITSINLEIP